MTRTNETSSESGERSRCTRCESIKNASCCRFKGISRVSVTRTRVNKDRGESRRFWSELTLKSLQRVCRVDHSRVCHSGSDIASNSTDEIYHSDIDFSFRSRERSKRDFAYRSRWTRWFRGVLDQIELRTSPLSMH